MDNSKIPFDAPEGYFGDFPKELAERIEREELLKAAPLLFSIPKKEVFSAPDFYFEKFVTRLREEKSFKKKPALYYLFQWEFRMAFFSVLAIMTVMFFLHSGQENTAENNPIAELSKEQIDKYVEEDLSFEIDYKDLSDWEVSAPEPGLVADASAESLENYLVNEMDLYDLMTEL